MTPFGLRRRLNTIVAAYTQDFKKLKKLWREDQLEQLYQESRAIDTEIRLLLNKRVLEERKEIQARQKIIVSKSICEAREAREHNLLSKSTIYNIDQRLRILREQKKEIQKTIELPIF